MQSVRENANSIYIMSRLQILITAGPTIEDIDPVRFLSNRSSGKMGYALAQSAVKLGHRVTLISGPTALSEPSQCHFIAVRSAQDMATAVFKYAKKADVIIKAAAVADYRAQKVAKQKIKKKSAGLTLKLVRTPDILKMLGQHKRPGQILVGFAAETNQILQNANKKIREKGLDFIVVNDVSQSDIGFEVDNNAVILIDKNGSQKRFKKQSKIKLAEKILEEIL